MPAYNRSSDRVLSIYLTLTEYPVLSARIRHNMRKQLFARGIITREAFDSEARQKAMQSQFREGLHDPLWRGNCGNLGRAVKRSYAIT